MPLFKPSVPTNTGKILTDSKICRHFARGFCSLGDTCSFKHDPASVGAIPIGTKPCTFYAKGLCTKGTRCTFLHENATNHPVSSPIIALSPVKTQTHPKNEQPQQKNTCNECEQAEPSVTCEECEEKYCSTCDTSVHASKVMSRHTRNVLYTVPVCGECEASKAKVKCAQCNESYCDECNETVHKFKTLRKHLREPIDSNIQPLSKLNKSFTKPSVAPQKSNNGYIDSIPKYELTSDSESDEDVHETPTMTVKITPTKYPPRKIATTPAKISTTPSKPRMELSSESSEDDDAHASQPFATKQPIKAAMPSAISSESESEEQKICHRPIAVKTQKGEISSESSQDDSDDDDIKYVSPEASSSNTPIVVKQAPSTTIPTATSSAHSTSSSDSSSEEEEDANPSKTTPSKFSTYTKKDLCKGARQWEFQQHRKNPRNASRRAQEQGLSVNSSHSVVKKIEAYVVSDNTEVLHLESHLNGFERLLAHDCAERFGLGHVSVGEGLERHLTIFKHGTEPPNKKQRLDIEK
jgi:hypothetical protein